jgi:hypothetical protein
MSGISVEKPGHDPAPERRVPATVVATWPVGTFVENIVARPDGLLVVSVSSQHELELIEPSGGRRTLATLPAAPTGISVLGTDLFVNAGEPGSAGWRLYRVREDGVTEQLLELPEARFLNGSTPFRGSRLLVADSILGRVFEIDTQTREYRVWLEHALLRKSSPQPLMPGANGIRTFGEDVYLTSTERALILRVPTTPDAGAMRVEVVAERFTGDDLAADGAGNLYVATHVHNQVMRLSNRGERTVLATAEDGIYGSTGVAFGRSASDRRALYVTTTGGIVAPIDGRVREAKLVRLDVGVAGADP